jgi:hypothetical protein
MASGDLECFYNFCGFGGVGVNYNAGTCGTCTITNCDECIFEDSAGLETCKLCDTGYYLQSDGSMCTLI